LVLPEALYVFAKAKECVITIEASCSFILPTSGMAWLFRCLAFQEMLFCAKPCGFWTASNRKAT